MHSNLLSAIQLLETSRALANGDVLHCNSVIRTVARNQEEFSQALQKCLYIPISPGVQGEAKVALELL